MVKFLSVLGVFFAAVLAVKFDIVQVWHLVVAFGIIALAVTVWVKTTDSGAAFWDIYDTPVIYGSKALIFLALFTPFAWTVGTTLYAGPQLAYVKETRSMGNGANKELEVVYPYGVGSGWSHDLSEVDGIRMVSDTEFDVNGSRQLADDVFPDLEVEQIVLTQINFWWQFDRKKDISKLGTKQTKGRAMMIWTTHTNISLPDMICEKRDDNGNKVNYTDSTCKWTFKKMITITDGGAFNVVTIVLATYLSLIVFSYVLLRRAFFKLRDAVSKKTEAL